MVNNYNRVKNLELKKIRDTCINYWKPGHFRAACQLGVKVTLTSNKKPN